MTHDTFMHFRHEKKNAQDCFDVVEKLERLALHHCYRLCMQRTLRNLDEGFFGFHSPPSISFKMEPLGGALMD